MLSIGKYIRVQSLDNTITRKAIISFIHNDNDSRSDCNKITYDIIYINSRGIQSNKEAKNEEEEEENYVSTERISLLQDFEYETILNNFSAIELKHQANIIFNLKDFQCAIEYYKKAISQLFSTRKFQIGQNVLVSFPNDINCCTGMISDVVKHNEELYDVMLDNYNHQQVGTNDENEVHGVKADRLIILMTDDQVDDCLLQRSIYLNIARSYLKLSLKGWAIKYASLAIATNHYIIYHYTTQKYAATIIDDDPKQKDMYEKLCADAYYFRAKALLIACRPKYATKDYHQLIRYDVSKARLLQQDIEQYKSQVNKSNKKLAKNIAAWINVAMNTTATSATTAGGNKHQSHGASDLDLLDEDSEILEKNQNSEMSNVESIHKNSTILINHKTRFQSPTLINAFIYVVLLSTIATYVFNYFVYS